MEDQGSWQLGQKFAQIISRPFSISSPLPIVPRYALPSWNLQWIPGAFPAGVAARRWELQTVIWKYCQLSKPRDGGGALVSSGQSPRAELSIPQCPGPYTPQRMTRPQMPVSLGVERLVCVFVRDQHKSGRCIPHTSFTRIGLDAVIKSLLVRVIFPFPLYRDGVGGFPSSPVVRALQCHC